MKVFTQEAKTQTLTAPFTPPIGEHSSLPDTAMVVRVVFTLLLAGTGVIAASNRLSHPSTPDSPAVMARL